jgi:hypothetical protein
MSDDLVKRLWESDEASALTNHAARRIEELERGFWNLHREYDRRGDRIEELQAKLTKAVEALDLLALHASGLEKQLTEDLFHQDFCGESVTLTCVRTTLAELKGEDRV